MPTGTDGLFKVHMQGCHGNAVQPSPWLSLPMTQRCMFYSIRLTVIEKKENSSEE